MRPTTSTWPRRSSPRPPWRARRPPPDHHPKPPPMAGRRLFITHRGAPSRPSTSRGRPRSPAFSSPAWSWASTCIATMSTGWPSSVCCERRASARGAHPGRVVPRGADPAPSRSSWTLASGTRSAATRPHAGDGVAISRRRVGAPRRRPVPWAAGRRTAIATTPAAAATAHTTARARRTTRRRHCLRRLGPRSHPATPRSPPAGQGSAGAGRSRATGIDRSSPANP